MPALRHAWLMFNPAWRSAWIPQRIEAIWSGPGRFRMGRSLAWMASYTIPIKTGPDFGGQATDSPTLIRTSAAFSRKEKVRDDPARSFPPRACPRLAAVAVAAIVGVGLAVLGAAVAFLDHL